ncbi:AarF/ABC1/UbiB kinase family protein [Paenibacillus sp. FSL K6-1096]|uniref:ABC1 kinase family protein n=1 Tax=Paenibacillus sp. FSL K6-1096 TaxID=2921460 RepID=UPI0030EEEA09
MGVQKRFRQLQRYRTITSAIARSGFGFIVHSSIGADGVSAASETDWPGAGKHIRLLLEELGTTFIKLGQLASTRPDLVPQPVVKELIKLQDAVPPFPYADVSRVIEEELGAPVSQLFRSFEPVPMASASIGQVHRAVLADGKEVAVKIQRPQLSALVETDLDILADLARLADRRGSWMASYSLTEVVEELGRGLLAELDYSQEAAHLEHFARTAGRKSHLRIPAVYRPYSSKRVLTMEYIEGIRLSNVEQLSEEGIRTCVVAERLAGAIFQQILVDGVFHADPHPGNILVLSGEEIALLDFGMVGRLSAHTQKHFASFIIALRNRSSKGVMRAIEQLGMIPEKVDRDKLYIDVEEMRLKFYDIPLKDVRLGDMLNDLFGVAFKHGIRVPSELTMVGKAILTTEGVVAELDPDFSMLHVAEPIGRRLYLERLSPWGFLKNTFEGVPDYLQIMGELPITMKRITAMLNKGKVQVEVVSPQLEQLMKKLDRISNQMSFSIVLLALSLVLLGLIIGYSINGVPTILWRLPVLETAIVISLLMFAWLLYSIFRSGRF